MQRFCPLFLVFALAGCAQFPALDDAVSPQAQAAGFPDLVPLEGLLAQSSPTTAPQQITDGVNARVSALRTRANRLRGRVLDPRTRQRMATGIAVR